MRENKYRGKTIDTDEFVYGHLVNSGHQVNPYIEFWWIAQNRYKCGSVFGKDTCDDTFIWNRIEPETAGQYTGLKDKNGVEIYEGDIVIAYGNDSIRWRVIYDQSHCMFTLCYGKNVDHFCGMIEEHKFAYEVIGNIYDNPELLKETEG